MSGDSDHLGDAMHDFHSRDTEDDFDADRRWAVEIARRRAVTECRREHPGACIHCGEQLVTGPWGFTDCPACNPNPARE
jgi:hypothetical protein